MEQRRGASPAAAEQAEEDSKVTNPVMGRPFPAMNSEDLTRASPGSALEVEAATTAAAAAAAAAARPSQTMPLEMNNCRRQRQRARVAPCKTLDASDPQVCLGCVCCVLA